MNGTELTKAPSPRVQLAISGKFVILFAVGLFLLGSGYYWYGRQQATQKRFQIPPYFVNPTATVVRSCVRCLELGKLKAQADWKIGPPNDIPTGERRWFLAVEDPPQPVTVSGVLMLPVHPSLREDPSFGFDQSKVLLVLYQGLQRMVGLERPVPAPDPLPAPPNTAPPAQPAANSLDLTPSSDLKIERIGRTAWRVEFPGGGQWYNTGIPVIPSQRMTIHPTGNEAYNENYGYWTGRIADHEFGVQEQNSRGEFVLDINHGLPFVSGPDWIASVYLRVRDYPVGTFRFDVDLQFQSTSLDTEMLEHQQYQKAWQRAEELMKLP